MIKIRFMPEYECYPLWKFNDGIYDNISPSDLPLSDELIEDIDKWDDSFQSTYNKLDPVTSGFSNSLEEKNFFSQSELLKQRLITELSCDYQVE